MADYGVIPEQVRIPWATAFVVSWAGLKRRFLRSMITMVGVILAIAFLSYMLTVQSVTDALVAVNNNDLNILLQEAGVDILAGAGPDRMMLLLLGLSLLTCMVGIVNAMLMSVTERVREIGTLKCLGARDLFIVKTYFIESSLQGVCGAALGMILGCVVAIAAVLRSYGTHVFAHFPAVPVIEALLVSLLAGSLISILAAIAPAYIAAKKQPIDALRVEE
ncbi:MAG: FtsX-like permease family protein [Planctomycetota bacterium]